MEGTIYTYFALCLQGTDRLVRVQPTRATLYVGDTVSM